jgi:hypothetical protein
MLKQKPSFFERLTGAQNVNQDNFESSVPVFAQDEEESIAMNDTSESFQPAAAPHIGPSLLSNTPNTSLNQRLPMDRKDN